MRTHSLFLCVLLVSVGGCATAAESMEATAPASAAAAPAPAPQLQPPAGLPPLIERELFFDDPEITGGQISPDGKFISFRKPYKGVANIWVKRREEPFDAARPLTADTKRPVNIYFWSAGRQAHPLRPGQGRRRELPHLRRRPGRPSPRGHRGAAGARPDALRGRARADPGRARVDARRADRRAQRPRPAAARRLPAGHRHRQAHVGAQERGEHRRLGLRSERDVCAWATARPPTAAPRSCGSTARSWPASTPAAPRSPAARSASTRTAAAST